MPASGQIPKIGLFCIDVCWQPHIGADILSPAIEVEVHLRQAGGAVGAIETDNVVILILNPDAPFECPVACLFRLNVENKTADRTQEFTPDIFEIVIVPVE